MLDVVVVIFPSFNRSISCPSEVDVLTEAGEIITAVILTWLDVFLDLSRFDARFFVGLGRFLLFDP